MDLGHTAPGTPPCGPSSSGWVLVTERRQVARHGWSERRQVANSLSPAGLESRSRWLSANPSPHRGGVNLAAIGYVGWM
eukprot:391585-Prorocentrum_minimum.AAC.2